MVSSPFPLECNNPFFFLVVVIGFEKSAYIVVEGEMLQVCVSVRNRTLTNDDPRLFQVQTMQLADFGASGGLYATYYPCRLCN